METVKFIIDGMMCAACSAAVEKALTKAQGVTNVSINLATGSAKVEYDEGILSENDISTIITNVGFSPRFPRKDHSDTIPTSESDDKRLIMTAVFAIPLIIFTMAEMLFGALPDFISATASPGVYVTTQAILIIPILFFARKTYVIGLRSFLKRAPTMDTLVSLGTLACLIYSIYATVNVYAGHSEYAMKLYFESAAMIFLFVYTGKYLEQRSKKKAASAIKSLIELQPSNAHLIRNNETVDVSPDILRKDDIIRILPGESVPADCIIEQGTTDADERMLTGESVPVAKNETAELYGGSINISSAVIAKVKYGNEESVLTGIIKAVEDAQASKAPVAKLADKVAGIFVPTVLGIAVLSALLWLLINKNPSDALNAFISVLVVACPCALGLATPTAIITATGTAAKHGIFFKDSEALQIFSDAETFAFDKTGTLTKGILRVEGIFPENCTEAQIIETAACAEFSSSHPIANAIITLAQQLNIPFSHDYISENIPGKGVISHLHETTIFAGTEEFLNEVGITPPPSEKQPGTAVFIATKNSSPNEEYKYLGKLILSDEIKADAKYVIERLNKEKKRTIMLTGDNRQTAELIGKQLGIEEIYADILPVDKSNTVKKLENKKGKTVFIGDGINDAPALAQADVGIAVNSGINAAVNSADVVLTGDKLSPLLTAFALSKKTMRIIRQNLIWAFAYNFISIPIAAGALTLLGISKPDPMFAALAMSLSSVTVVTNSLRLRRK